MKNKNNKIKFPRTIVQQKPKVQSNKKQYKRENKNSEEYYEDDMLPDDTKEYDISYKI